jgi:hypothetical protein
VLRLSYFPDGWRASTRDDADTSGQDEFRRCLGTDYSQLTIIGEAESDEFAEGNSTEVASEAAIYGSAAEAVTALEEFASGRDAIEECVGDAIHDAAEDEDEVEIGDVDAGELSFTPPPGVDAAQAWQIAVPFETKSGALEGFSATYYLDLILLRKGDVVLWVETQDVLTPFDSDLRDLLLSRAAGRMGPASE